MKRKECDEILKDVPADVIRAVLTKVKVQFDINSDWPFYNYPDIEKRTEEVRAMYEFIDNQIDSVATELIDEEIPPTNSATRRAFLLQ